MSKVSRVSSKSDNSKSEEQPQSNNQSIEERVMIMMKKKLAKRKRLPKKEFVEEYVPRHNLFYGVDPTKEEINSAHISRKGSGNRKRVKRKSERMMSKEEHFATNTWNHQLFWGEIPTEEVLNKDYDLYKLEHQCKSLRSEKRKAAFRECMAQEIADRYSPAKIEERRLEKEIEMNKHNIT